MNKDAYAESMEVHVDEGGTLSHTNGAWLLGEVRRLRGALERVVAESDPDTPYSWCQTKLARCNTIASITLHEDPTDGLWKRKG